MQISRWKAPSFSFLFFVFDLCWSSCLISSLFEILEVEVDEKHHSSRFSYSFLSLVDLLLLFVLCLWYSKLKLMISTILLVSLLRLWSLLICGFAFELSRNLPDCLCSSAGKLWLRLVHKASSHPHFLKIKTECCWWNEEELRFAALFFLAESRYIREFAMRNIV